MPPSHVCLSRATGLALILAVLRKRYPIATDDQPAHQPAIPVLHLAPVH